MKTFRTQIIERIEQYGLSHAKAVKIYNAILDVMVRAIVSRKALLIRNFGTFKVKRSKSKIVCSSVINNGKPTKTRSLNYIRFKTSSNLKTLLNS
jgi:nucleoid DNA-binding protein